MSAVKRIIKQEQEKISHVSFSVSCTAISGEHKMPVDLNIPDLEKFSRDESIINEIRASMVPRILRHIPPSKFDADIRSINADEFVKAWAFCILWFALSTPPIDKKLPDYRAQWEEVSKPWRDIYRQKTTPELYAIKNEIELRQYNHRLERLKRRAHAVLREIGIPVRWLRSNDFTVPRIMKALNVSLPKRDAIKKRSVGRPRKN